MGLFFRIECFIWWLRGDLIVNDAPYGIKPLWPWPNPIEDYE